jgi:hypothetical protein
MSKSRPAGLVLLVAIFAVDRLLAHDVAAPLGHVDLTGSMSVPRAAQTATLLPDGRVLIAGGMLGNGSFLASAELYDAATGTFTAAAPMHTARVGHSAVLLPHGRVLVVGGGRGKDQALAEIYDVATGEWIDAGQIRGECMALLRDGTVLIGGERDAASGLRSSGTYDPTTRTLTPSGNLNSQLYGPATLLADGRVLIAGGENDSRMFGEAELYDPIARKWTDTGKLITPRDKHAATLLQDGRVLVTGGSDKGGWRGQMTSTEIFDPRSRVFAAGPNMSSSRFKLQGSVTLLPTGQVLVAGGSTDVEIYDPRTDRFGVARGSLDEPRFFSSATTLADGRVLIAGGYVKGTITSTDKAWLYKQ